MAILLVFLNYIKLFPSKAIDYIVNAVNDIFRILVYKTYLDILKKEIQKVKTFLLYRRTTNAYSARQPAVSILSELENLSQMKKVRFFKCLFIMYKILFGKSF